MPPQLKTNPPGLSVPQPVQPHDVPHQLIDQIIIGPVTRAAGAGFLQRTGVIGRDPPSPPRMPVLNAQGEPPAVGQPGANAPVNQIPNQRVDRADP